MCVCVVCVWCVCVWCVCVCVCVWCGVCVCVTLPINMGLYVYDPPYQRVCVLSAYKMPSVCQIVSHLHVKSRSYLSSTFAPSVTASCLLKPISAFTVISFSLHTQTHSLSLSVCLDSGLKWYWLLAIDLEILNFYFYWLCGLWIGYCTCKSKKKTLETYMFIIT